MAHDRTRPGFGDRRRAEQLLLAFDLAHHEIAGLEPPIDVPLGRLIAGVQKQRALGLAPGDRKLVLPGEVADAAEVEYHDRVQRMLSRCAERAVIDQLAPARKNPAIAGTNRIAVRFQDICRRPDDVSGKDGRGDQRIRTQQDAEGAQRKRQHLHRPCETARRIRRPRRRSRRPAARWSQTAHRAR